jgi:hypothetical protein
MTLDASGRLGIGTAAPQHLCQIAGTLAVDSFNDATRTITLRPGFAADANGGMGLQAKDHSGSAPDGLGIYGTDGVSVMTANAGTFFERLRVDTSGRVGIGTTSPGHDIDLRKDAAGSTVTLRVRNDNVAADSNSALVLDTPNGVWGVRALRSGGRLAVDIGGSEKAAIDASGRLLVGTSTSNSNTNSKFQIADTSGNVTTTSYSANNSSAGYYYFFKNRGASVDSHTVLQSGDGIANLYFAGSDGTTYRGAASIEAVADGGWSSGDAPGRLVFSTTADGASSPTERMRIKNNGELVVPSVYTNTTTWRATGLINWLHFYSYLNQCLKLLTPGLSLTSNAILRTEK